jgi:hypothetical protein
MNLVEKKKKKQLSHVDKQKICKLVKKVENLIKKI